MRSGATVLAGGQSLVAEMAFRRARPALLADIGGIEELAGHAFPDDAASDLVLGATCRQEVLARWRPADPRWSAIPQAAGAIGNYVIRMRGTVGGSIAHADPAAELPAIFLLFDGQLSARSTSGQRVLESSEVFTGPQRTTLAKDELITELRLKGPPYGAVTAFRELSERVAVAGAGVGVGAQDGHCAWCRIALCGVAETPIRATQAERRLLGSALGSEDVEEAAWLAAAACSPISDTHGSADFRRSLAATLVRANLTSVISKLGGPWR
jgi:CO/xanthine dehydrogenase FAD-binding subunit